MDEVQRRAIGLAVGSTAVGCTTSLRGGPGGMGRAVAAADQARSWSTMATRTSSVPGEFFCRWGVGG